MTMFLVNTIPSWLLAVLTTATCVGFAFLVTRVINHAFRGHLQADHNELAGAVLQAWGAVYAVLLALVVIALWEQREEVDAHATEEAGYLVAVYRDVGGMPPEFAKDARQKVQAYARAVIERSYPALRIGAADEETRTTYNDLFVAIRDYPAAGNRHHEMLLAEALRELNLSSEARTKRLSAVRGGLPPVFWAVLLVTTAITLASVGALHAESYRVRMLVTAGFAIGVGALLFLVVVLDHPYSGDLSVTPEPYLEALESMRVAR
jgi:hypothetical protein